MDYCTWRKRFRMIAAAANNASTFAARQDLLVAHKDDLPEMCLIVHFSPRDRQALTSDVHLFQQLSQIAAAGIKAIAQQDSEPVPTGMLDACLSVSLALQNAVYVTQQCGRDADMDPDVMTEWSAAVKPIIRQLQQLKQQGTAHDSSVARAGAFLQKIWFIAATSTVHRPAVFNSRVLASMPDAAELAVLLLTVPGAVEAREDIPALPQVLGSNVQLVTSLSLPAASCSILVISQYLCMQGDSLLAAPASVPPAPVSDAVQVAAALHVAALLSAHDQRQAAGQGSESHQLLQQLGFPLGLAQAYRDSILQVFGPNDPTTSDVDVYGAASSLKHALMVRARATAVPGWQQRYADYIAASATANAPASVSAAAAGELPRDDRLFAPGVDPVQLQLLVLDVASYASERANVPRFTACLDLIVKVLQAATPTPEKPTEVAAVVQQMWLVLGRNMLRLSGVSAAALADSVSAGIDSGGGSGQAAAAGVGTGGDIAPLPAGAAAQLQDMWAKFATALFRTFYWATKGYVGYEVMQGLFMAHPMLASRVYAAAARACTPQAVAEVGGRRATVISGAVWAAQACNPIQLPAQTLLTGRQLAKRMGSQLVSSIKQLQVASVQDSLLLSSWLNIANVAACFSSELWAKAAEAPTPAPATAAAAPSKQAILKAAAPTLNVWLFTTGRALLEIGRLLELAPALLAACRPRNCPEVSAERISYVSQHTEALRFLQDVLPELSAMQQEAAGQPAAAASPMPQSLSQQRQQRVQETCRFCSSCRGRWWSCWSAISLCLSSAMLQRPRATSSHCLPPWTCLWQPVVPAAG